MKSSGKFTPVGFLILGVTWGGAGCCHSVFGGFIPFGDEDLYSSFFYEKSVNDNDCCAIIYFPGGVYLHGVRGMVGWFPCVYIAVCYDIF